MLAKEHTQAQTSSRIDTFFAEGQMKQGFHQNIKNELTRRRKKKKKNRRDIVIAIVSVVFVQSL